MPLRGAQIGWSRPLAPASETHNMPFRNLIDGGSFAPEALTVMYEAFDLAWAEVASEYGNDPTRTEFARSALAQAILSAAEEDPTEAVRLKTAALEAFATRNQGKS